jgi:hypothetical protein
VDFVFSPAIWNLEKDAFHCSKLKGLPDITKATVPDCPPLLLNFDKIMFAGPI